jgi:hypothetical protein
MWSLTDIKQRVRYFYGLSRRAEAIYAMLNRMYREPLLAAEKAADPLVLAPYGFTAYSQSDDDGILEEIFRRIGTTNRQFIDFGCAEGIENNTTYMLLTGWSGLWMDGGESNIQSVKQAFAGYVQSRKLQVKQAFITRENINDLIREARLDVEPDLLNIDLDGNDYWIWEAIDCVRPRVVAIEYNATFRPPHQIVQVYKASHRWGSDAYFGASLKALETLGTRKGYALVGCNFVGTNAFFVREDLVDGKFSKPFTAEHHYREAMYDAFVRGYSRHRKAVGAYVNLAEQP